MNSYKRFYHDNDSKISIEHWSGSSSQATHMHKYYELVFIEKGSCTHHFQKEEILLLPGDSFLVSPEKSHSFSIHEHTSIYNCQFYPEQLDPDVFALIQPLQKESDNLSILSKLPRSFQADINKQGIVHLDLNEQMFLLSILGGIEKAQKQQGSYDNLLKKKYLEIILIIYKKRSEQQFKNYYTQPKQHQKMILRTMEYIEEHLTSSVDFHLLAKNENLSTNHFRKLFKDITGLSPVEYINRLRIIKACEYLHHSDMNISEVAANVGIYDANYFSRLFKNFMGCSPKQYLHRSSHLTRQDH